MPLQVESNNTRRSIRESVVILAIASFICAVVLLIAQGRLFPPGLTYVPSLEKLVFDGCYLLSLPGVMLAVAIWVTTPTVQF
jgi:hypothetical protein